MCTRRLDWVDKCFQHFLETFNQVSEHVKTQLLNLSKSIEDMYKKLEEKIEEMAETVKDAKTVTQSIVHITVPIAKLSIL